MKSYEKKGVAIVDYYIKIFDKFEYGSTPDEQQIQSDQKVISNRNL